MAKMTGFCGPSNRQWSINHDDEETINWFPFSAEAGLPKDDPALYPSPSLEPFVTCGTGPVRAIFAQDQRAFAVSGAYFYEIFGNQTSIVRGAVRPDSRSATISSNGAAGNQIFITSGGRGYIWNFFTGTFTQIDTTTFPSFPSTVASGLFFDGYFIALDGLTGQFWLSDLEDGLAWNGLDFGAVSTFSDRVIAMAKTHDNLVLFGTKNTQLWYDSGNANFPFTPVPGATIEHGILAEFSWVEMDNTIYYLGADDTGNGAVWKLNGYTPVEISTPAMRYYLQQSKKLDQAVGWSFQYQKHIFYVLYVPDLDTQIVYDVATGLWWKWALWSELYMRWFPQVGRCHAFTTFQYGQHLIGDRQSGAIYNLNLTGPLAGRDLIVWTGPPITPIP